MWKPNYSVWEFSLHFPTMAPEKACVVASSEVVSGFPTMAPETSLDGNFLIAKARVPCLLPQDWGESALRIGLGGWGEARLSTAPGLGVCESGPEGLYDKSVFDTDF